MQATDTEASVDAGEKKVNYWSHIWNHPSLVFDGIGHHYLWKTFWWIAFVNVFIFAIYTAAGMYHLGSGHAEMANNAAHPAPPGVMLAGTAFGILLFSVLMFIGTVICWLISSAFLKMTGSWFGGTAKYRDICILSALLTVPYIELMLIESIIACIVGFVGGGNPEFFLHPESTIGGLFDFLLGAFVFVFTLVIGCKGLARIQGYPSAWRGLGNYVLAWLIMGVLIFALSFVIAMLLPMMAVPH